MSKALLVRAVSCALGVLLLGIRTEAAAQQRDTVLVVTPVPTRAQGSVRLPDVDRGTTPGGAFVRALLIPGWGHASIGAYTRGGFYFAAETTTGFLLARTMRRLALAKDARDLREEGLRESLLASGASADSVDALVEADPRVARSRRLVRSRQQQVEDWAALGVFTMFLSGADAFVSAHLRNFPEPVSATLEVAPGSPDGAGGVTRAVTVGLRLPVGRPRRHR